MSFTTVADLFILLYVQCMLISLSGLIRVCKILKNFYSKMRPVRLISINKSSTIIKRCFGNSTFWPPKKKM